MQGPISLVHAYLNALTRPPDALLPSSIPSGVLATGGMPFAGGANAPHAAGSAERACGAAEVALMTAVATRAYEFWASGVSLLPPRRPAGGGRRGGSRRLGPAGRDLRAMSPSQRAAYEQAVAASIKSQDVAKFMDGIAGARQLVNRFGADCKKGVVPTQFRTGVDLNFALGFPLFSALSAATRELRGHVHGETITIRLADTPGGWRIRLSGEALVPGLLMLDVTAFNRWASTVLTGSGPWPSATGGRRTVSTPPSASPGPGTAESGTPGTAACGPPPRTSTLPGAAWASTRYPA